MSVEGILDAEEFGEGSLLGSGLVRADNGTSISVYSVYIHLYLYLFVLLTGIVKADN